ncbi:tetratricopeptide repeat protein [Aquabacterium humicola]|uniref:tetratricopeptide repeat protein n=1 Tax=Aquabacterium humicola TaxID=3237377 RepID=UPI0025427A8E|nr:hypothetical protein [Rubrivivax pictus]
MNTPDASIEQRLALIETLFEKSDFSAVLQICNDIIELDDGHFEAHSERARANQRLGRLGDAMSDLQVLIDLRPDSPTAYLRRAALNMELGHDALAVMDLSRVVELGDGYYLSTAHFYRAIAYHNIGDKEASRRDATLLPNDFRFFVKTKDHGTRQLSRQEVLDLAS